MLSGAWKGGKKTNKPQTNRKRGCSSCLRCLLSMCFAGRYGFNFNLFFGACCLDRCWWKTGLKQVLGVCVYVGGKCSSPPPKKNTQQMKIERSPARDPAVLYSSCTGTHTHTQMYTSTKQTQRDTNTPPWPIHLAHTSICTVLRSNLCPALEEMQMSGRSVVPVLGVSRSFLLLLALPVPLLFSWSELR